MNLKIMPLKPVIYTALFLIGSLTSHALVVNVDLDRNAGEGFSGQGGYADAGNNYWNSSIEGMSNLTASDGVTPTTIDLSISTSVRSSAIGGNIPAGQSHSDLVGDYAFGRDEDITVDITGLEPNEPYQLYLYCQGDVLEQKATVTFPGNSAVSTSGLVDGAIVEGGNYVVLNVAADAGGVISGIVARNGSRFAPFNGIQIVELNPAQPRVFVHPGIGYTQDDLEVIKANLGVEPWKTGYEDLQAETSLSYNMQGPFATVGHTAAENRNEWRADMIAMHNLARMWYFTDNEAYAQKARDILINWATAHTQWVSGQVYLDMGYHAHDVFQGAEILRGTWPGWTEADTDTCKAYFNDVWWDPAHLPLPNPLRSANQGMAQLTAALGVAVFNDDEVKFDQCLHAFRADAPAALLSSLPNGQVGDTGRDSHDQGQLLLMARCAETFWQQGVDVYSEYDNRLLAAAEYLSRFHLQVDTPYIQAGTVYDVYAERHSLAGPFQVPGFETPMINILYGAYVTRQGIRSPYLEKFQSLMPQNLDSFTYLIPVDNSTAEALPPLSGPAEVASVTSLTSTNMGDATGGGASYSNGTWTVSGRGSSLWFSSVPDYHFAFLPVTGDATIIAQMTSLSGGSTQDARAGLVFSENLTNGAAMQGIVITNPSGDEEMHSFRRGDVARSHQTNNGFRVYPRQSVPKVPYWLKIERIGNRVNCYSSPDGSSWSCGESADYDVGSTAYFGLAVSSDTTNSTATATFTDVRITGGDGGEVVEIPEAPFAIYASPGGDEIPLRWLRSFEADSYNVWRATQPGGSYSLITQQAGTSYVDTNVNFGTQYYYAVSAVNAMGESHLSPVDGLKLVNSDWYEAEDFDDQNGIQTEATVDYFSGENLSFISGGDWTRYDDIPIGVGDVFRARVAGFNEEIGSIEIRLDSPTGTLIGTVDVIDTGGTQDWGTVETTLSTVAGVYDLYLVYTSVTPGSSSGFNLNWFDVVPSTSTTRIEAEAFITEDGTRTEATQDIGGGLNVGFIQHDEWLHYGDFTFRPDTQARVRLARPANRPPGVLEFRLDSPTGAVVGSLDLFETGDWQIFETFEVPMISPLIGTHPLYLVFRETSAVIDGASLVNINWFELSYSSISEYDLGMDTSITFDPTVHILTNASSIAEWDSASTYLKLQDGSDLSGIDFTQFGLTSWATTDFNDSSIETKWDGASLSGLTLITDGNFGAGDSFTGADFSNVVWGSSTTTASATHFFSGGSGASSIADRDEAISFSGADLSLVSGSARAVMIDNLGGFDGETPIGAKYDTAFLAASGWDDAQLVEAGWQFEALLLVNSSGSSSFPSVSSSDLAQAQFLSSSATGGQEASEHASLFNGGRGNTDSDTNDGSEVRLDSGNTVTVTLDTSVNIGGYDLTGITTYFGWNPAGNGRSNQGYEVILTYMDGSTATLAGPMHWEPNSPANYWTKVSFADDGGGILDSGTIVHNGSSVTGPDVRASGVKAVTFDIANNGNAGGWVVAREFDIFGSPTPFPLTAIDQWRFVNFGSHENEGAAADGFDADFDGLSNLLEYATGQNPNDSSDAEALQIVSSSTTSEELEIRFNRIEDPSLVYELEGSENLSASSWSPLMTISGTASDTVTISESLWPQSDLYFFRLKVTR